MILSLSPAIVKLREIKTQSISQCHNFSAKFSNNKKDAPYFANMFLKKRSVGGLFSSLCYTPPSNHYGQSEKQAPNYMKIKFDYRNTFFSCMTKSPKLQLNFEQKADSQIKKIGYILGKIFDSGTLQRTSLLTIIYKGDLIKIFIIQLKNVEFPTSHKNLDQFFLRHHLFTMSTVQSSELLLN